jgi:hypothetical protein
MAVMKLRTGVEEQTGQRRDRSSMAITCSRYLKGVKRRTNAPPSIEDERG